MLFRSDHDSHCFCCPCTCDAGLDGRDDCDCGRFVEIGKRGIWSAAQVAALTESQAIKDEQVLLAASGRAVAYATLWFLFVKNRAS